MKMNIFMHMLVYDISLYENEILPPKVFIFMPKNNIFMHEISMP